MRRISLVIFALFVFTVAAAAQMTDLTTAQKNRVAALLKEYQVLGSDPVVVKAVREFNAAPPPETKGMTQGKWAGLTVLGTEVKSISKNPLAEYLKTKRTPAMAELFVSGADGTKVAFFAKTTGWSHKGKPKHDVPMTGKTWTGAQEQDESSGKITVQVSFPVLDGGKPIGSIVIGLDVGKL
jgi:hypothetical protein